MTAKTVQKIEAEIEIVAERDRQRRKAAKEDQVIWDRLHAELRAAKLQELVGIPGAVQLASRYGADERLHVHNDSKGTVTKVRRTRCTVDFGTTEKPDRWNLSIHDVQCAGETQGVFISMP